MSRPILTFFKAMSAHWRSYVIVLVPILLLPLAFVGTKLDRYYLRRPGATSFTDKNWRIPFRYLLSLIQSFISVPIGIGKARLMEARCAYVVGVMALYWMTEAVPLPVTSLLPIVMFPMLGVLSTEEICVCYFKEPNMMFIGGLIVAIAVEHCNLHKRVALRVLLFMGTSPTRLMFGFMMTTMLLSMFISNTACTAMMVPIVAAVLDELKAHESNQTRRISLSAVAGVAKSRHDSGTFDEETRRKSGGKQDVAKLTTPTKQDICYFLGVAYAANIGGTGTLTGTGTNLTFRGLFESIFHSAEGLNFATWMTFNVPLMLINCFLAWLWLRILFMGLLRKKRSDEKEKELEKSNSVRAIIQQNYDELGPMTFHEFSVFTIFLIVVSLWFFRRPEFMPGWGQIYPDVAIDDATVAIFAVFLLFILPANLDFLNCSLKNRKTSPSLLNWRTVHEKVPWGLVILSGGGFAMAAATKSSGLSRYLGEQLTALRALPPSIMLIVICLGTTFMTEVSSNTAIANIVLPVLAEMCVAIETNPLYLMLPATLCCSYAFMLPVATPPNAIVVAASNMPPSQMAKAGLGMNFICVISLIICLKSFGMTMYNLEEFPQFAIDYKIAHNESFPM